MRAAAIAISALVWGTILAVAADTTQDVATLLADKDSAHRLRAQVSFIASLSPAEIPEAVKLAEAGYGQGRESLLAALAGRWVEVDPKAAVAYARQDEFRDTPGDILEAYYDVWCRRDWAGALAAVNQLPQGKERATAAYALATSIASSDPAQAHALIKSVYTTNLESIDYPIYWAWARKDLNAATQTLVQESGYGQNRQDVDLTWDIVDSLFDQDPLSAAKWIDTLPKGQLQDTAFDHLVDIWGRSDPAAAVVWLKTLPTTSHIKDAINNTSDLEQRTPKELPVPVKADPAFADKAAEFASIRKEPIAWKRNQRMIAFVDGLAPAEFPQALEQLRRAPPFGCEDELDLLVAKWTQVGLPGMIAAIPQKHAFYDEIFAARVSEDIFRGWAQKDPDAAFAFARQRPLQYDSTNVLGVTLKAIARKNPTSAYVAFKALRDPNSHVLVTPVFYEWADADLLAATKALKEEGHWEGAIQGIVQSRLQHGLPAAVKWAHQLKDPQRSDKALALTATYAENIEETLKWLEQGPDFPSKHSAFDDVAVDWANRNSISALRYASTLPEGQERSSLMMWALITYTYDDAPIAAAWCERLPEGKDKVNSLAVVFGTWAENDAPSAAKYLSDKPADATASVLETVADSWARFDPPATAAWLLAFPGKSSNTRAIGKVAEQWYHADPSEATRWVNQLPAGASYDAGAMGICVALNGDIPVALKWARSISDPKIRHDAVYNAYAMGTNYRGMYWESPGMRDEIQHVAELTPDDKKKLLAQLPVIHVFDPSLPVAKPNLSSDHKE